MLICPYCDKGFFWKKDLDRHLPKHTGLKSYNCQVCQNKKYSRFDNLIRHYSINHPGLEPPPKARIPPIQRPDMASERDTLIPTELSPVTEPVSKCEEQDDISHKQSSRRETVALGASTASRSQRQSTARTSTAPTMPHKLTALLPLIQGAEIKPLFFDSPDLKLATEEKSDILKQQSEGDDQSTVSVSTIGFTPLQKYSKVKSFTDALLCNSRGGPISLTDNPSAVPLHNRCQELVREYASRMIKESQEKPQKKASKAVQKLHYDIAKRCEEVVLGNNDIQANETRPLVALQADQLYSKKTLTESVNRWLEGVEVDTVSAGAEMCSDISTLVHRENKTLERPTSTISYHTWNEQTSDIVVDMLSDEHRPLFDYLIKHSAFTELATKIERVMEKHHGDAMEVIKDKILAAIRSPPSAMRSTPSTTAHFHFELDILLFLRDQYDVSLEVDLGAIITLTGRAKNAVLLPAAEYLQFAWKEHTFLLLDALKNAISNDHKAHHTRGT
jgi:hypothetical protein